MRTWKREEYRVVEREHDYDLHCFVVIVKGKDDQIIYPDSIDAMNSIIHDLDNGDDVDGWEDGMGNTIYTTTTKYRGLVVDDLKTLDTRKTKLYLTYKEAHDAAEKLCKRTMGDRGTIEVDEI